VQPLVVDEVAQFALVRVEPRLDGVVGFGRRTVRQRFQVVVDRRVLVHVWRENKREREKKSFFFRQQKLLFFCFFFSLFRSLSLSNLQAASTTMRSCSGTFFQSGVTGKSGVLASALSTTAAFCAAGAALLLDPDSFEAFFETATGSDDADILQLKKIVS
jgi:hypothetical protein